MYVEIVKYFENDIRRVNIYITEILVWNVRRAPADPF